jgi:hypothetical protein
MAISWTQACPDDVKEVDADIGLDAGAGEDDAIVMLAMVLKRAPNSLRMGYSLKRRHLPGSGVDELPPLLMALMRSCCFLELMCA